MTNKLITLLALCGGLSCGATTLTVDKTSGDDAAAAADLTRATAFATIQAAVDAAAAGDVVRVQPGVYDVAPAESASVVTISKALMLEAVSDDPAATVIDGKSTLRCVHCTVSEAVVKGFSLINGQGQGGGFLSKGTSGSVVVDCAIRNCTGGAGPSIYGARAVRCRVVDSVDGAVRKSTLYNCLVTRTRAVWDPAKEKYTTTGALSESYAYNCTIVDNPSYAMRASVQLFNSVVLNNNNVSASSDAGLYITNSVAAPWRNDNTTPDPTTCVAQTSEMCFFAPNAGDWRPMEGSVLDKRGNAALLESANLPDGIDPYVDLAGNPYPTKTGAIAAGAFQEVIATNACSGTVVLMDGVIGVNGYRPQLAGGYFRSAVAGQEFNLTGYPADGSETVGFSNPDLVGGMAFPDMNEDTWLLTPPNGVETTNSMVTAVASHVLFVDPDKGDDDKNDGQTPDAPYATLQKAIDRSGEISSSGKFVIHAAAGVYTNGSYGIARFCLNRTRLRIKGAGIGQSIVYGRKATGTEEQSDGRGNDALRVVMANNSARSCVQGFTLANGYTEAGDTTASNRKGGIVFGGDGTALQVTDCELRNGWSARGALVWNAIVKRCVLRGQDMALSQAHVREGAVISCLFRDNATTDALLYNVTLRQSTVYGNLTRGLAPVDSGIVPYNVIVANVAKFNNETAYGCLTDAADASGAACTRGDPCFVDAANGDFRLLTTSPALTCGATDAEAWKYHSRDLNSRPILMVGGKPVVGALQDPVQALVASGSAKCGIAPSGTVAVEQGDSVTFTGTTGVRPALDLLVDGQPVGAVSWTYHAPTGAYPTQPIIVSAVYQTNLYVNADVSVGDDVNNDGLSAATPKRTFAGILPLVLSGDTIHAAEGAYDSAPIHVAACTNVLTRLLVTNANVRIVADAGAGKTFIVGAPAPNPDTYGMGVGATRCVYVNAKDVTIAGFTLTGARTVNDSSSSDANVQGGAIRSDGANLQIVDCIISNNVATWAAAGYGASMIRCRVLENTSVKYRVTYGGTFCNCFFDYNRAPTSQGVAYSAYGFDNCTFGEHNYSLTETTPNYAIAYPCKDCPVRNCVFLCKVATRVGGTEYANRTIRAENCAYAIWPTSDGVFTNDQCVAVTADCVDPDGRPMFGSPLVDAGTNCVLETGTAFMDSDLDGTPRVFNGVIDIGCGEYDWRPEYSKALGAAVTAASPGVRLVDGRMRLSDGETLSVEYAGNVGRKCCAFAQVTGEGELAVAKDDEPFASVGEADGLKEICFRPTALLTAFDFAYAGAGFAELLPFAGPRGLLLLVR